MKFTRNDSFLDSQVTDKSVDNALEGTSKNTVASTAVKTSDGTSNLISILSDDSEPRKITPKIVDVKTSVPKTYEKKNAFSIAEKNVSSLPKQQSQPSTSSKFAFFTEMYIKNLQHFFFFNSI